MLGVAALCVAGETFARKGLFSILVAAIFCHGIPWGVFQVVSASYISEVSPVKLRGMLTTWINLCWVVGQFLAAIVAFALLRVDSEYGWKGAYSIQWLFIVVLATVVGFSPESPYWYLQRKRFAEAERTLKRFARKGDPVWAKAKMALMCHTLQQEEHDGDGVANTPSKFQPLKSFFNAACYRGTNRRRTSIACMTWVIQSCCGSAIIGWAPVFFQSAGLRSDKALAFNMAIPGVGVIGTLASWGLMLRWGRRRIFLAGLLVQAIVLGICGGFGFLPQRVGGWAAGGTIVAFTLVYDLSIGPIAYSIAAEVPSIVLRSQTLSIARSCYLLTGIVNHVLTPKLLDSMSWNLGAKTAFIFAAINLLGFVYTWFSIPEIKDIDARQMDVLFQAQVSARGFSSEKAAELD